MSGRLTFALIEHIHDEMDIAADEERELVFSFNEPIGERIICEASTLCFEPGSIDCCLGEH